MMGVSSPDQKERETPVHTNYRFKYIMFLVKMSAIVLWMIALAVSWFMIRPALTDTAELLESMEPFLLGGHMIQSVTPEGSTWAEIRMKPGM